MCNETDHPLPTTLTEPMTTMQRLSVNFLSHGAALSYVCGVLGSEKALVFDGDDVRLLQTHEIDTTDAM